MARQRIHNRRAARGSSGGGASWISYSDMMAALLLIFVLILCYSLYQYFSMLETKTRELEQQQIQLNLAQNDLAAKEKALIIIQTDLDSLKETLTSKEEELNAANVILISREKELEELQAVLALKQADLDAATAKLAEQQLALTSQAKRIEDLIGVKANIIQDLSASLSKANMKATVDPNNGDIVLDSAVFFETGKSTIKAEGQALLDRFIPVYLDVLLRPEYEDYLGEIIIEGHTDSSGSYDNNLKLSQDRALQVALYCLNLNTLSRVQKNKLQQIMTAKGRSYSDLVYDANGREDADASRRVEFKFSLKDSEMIEEMNRILEGDGAQNGADPAGEAGTT
ncbi:MAG: cell envelope biogenesis protein OmpA [Clostridiales bacterium]|nr:cell envelope biogenesis protein OmpA [Clostridiales bacterium]